MVLIDSILKRVREREKVVIICTVIKRRGEREGRRGRREKK